MQGTLVPSCLQALQLPFCSRVGSVLVWEQELRSSLLPASQLRFVQQENLKQKTSPIPNPTSPSQPATAETNPRPLPWDFSLEGSIVINGVFKAQRGPCVFGRKRLDTGLPCALLGVIPAPCNQRSWDGQGQGNSAGSSCQNPVVQREVALPSD